MQLQMMTANTQMPNVHLLLAVSLLLMVYNMISFTYKCVKIGHQSRSVCRHQGIINMNRNGNFCEGTSVGKIIAETKVDARVEH